MNPPTDDTALLLRYLRGGDQAAFAELMRHHLAVVYTVALRVTGNAEMAADVSQDVFLKLARNPLAVMKGVPLAAWLHRTTRHRALDLIRSERSRTQRERAAIPETQAEDMPREILSMLDEVIDKLPAADRALVVQRFISGESFSSISIRAGLTKDATRMRVNRALEKMRKLFGARGVSSTAALLAGTLQAQALSSPPPSLATGILAAARTITPVSTGLLPLILMTTTQKVIVGTAVLAIAVVTVAVSKRGTTGEAPSASRQEATGNTAAPRDRTASLPPPGRTIRHPLHRCLRAKRHPGGILRPRRNLRCRAHQAGHRPGRSRHRKRRTDEQDGIERPRRLQTLDHGHVLQHAQARARAG